MKPNINLIPLFLLFTINVGGQINPNSYTASIDKKDFIYPENNVVAKEEVKYKADNVADRKEFYATTSTFDPAMDYPVIFGKNVAMGVPTKTENGKVKLMNDDNTTPSVLYNNAAPGTILKLNNPDNGKTTYAIVIGKIPPSDSKSFLVVLGEKAAKNLSIKNYSSIELISCIDTSH